MNKEIQNRLKNISLATSYLSGYVFDNISLKLSLKDISVAILNESASLNDISKIKKLLESVLDLVDLGRIDDSVSEMNARVFSQGLTLFLDHLYSSDLSVIDSLEEAQKNEKDRSVADRLTEILGGAVDESEQSKIEDKVTKRVVSAMPKIEENKELEEESESKMIAKETLLVAPVEKDIKLSPRDAGYIFQTVEESQSAQRRAAILSVLAVGGNSVNDIKYKFPQYSPKTLQRDINEMIDEKKIVRIGDKRWAKYYIK
jgi:hypothetical protein